MKIKLLICALALTSSAAFAQKGTIGARELQEIKESYTLTDEASALRNAIRSTEKLKTLALNSEMKGTVDHNFKYRVKGNNTISDQHQSGRCWMFTSMNEIRPLVVEKYNLPSFDFSHNYNYFWDLFEKSNLFMQNMIETATTDMDDREVVSFFSSPIDDGGVWNHFYNVAEKYGVVPKTVMPETIHSENSAQMLSVLKELLRKGGYDIRTAAAGGASEKELNTIKMTTLKDVYRVLALCLGEPPVSFDWKYTNKAGEVVVAENMTPMSFYESIKPEDFNNKNYIMVMNDPTRAYYEVYDIKNYRNTEEGINWSYLNLPNDVIKEAAIKSIKNNEPMYTSSDVGKELNMSEGVLAMGMYDMESLLGVDLTMDKKARILTRQSGSAHAMLLVAVDTDKDENPVKWQVENSWGPAAGAKGYLTMTDEWFDNYIFRVVINKEYLDAKAQKALKNKPIQLPVWDYMF